MKQYGTVDVDQQQILQAYFATKNYSRLEAIYKARVAKDPTDIQSALQTACCSTLFPAARQLV